MIKEDIEKEMKVASEEEADALKAYQELTADSQVCGCLGGKSNSIFNRVLSNIWVISVDTSQILSEQCIGNITLIGIFEIVRIYATSKQTLTKFFKICFLS